MNFDIAYQIILPLMQGIVAITHSYGWAIVILTIGFRILVAPLVAQTTVHMRRMSKLQPHVKALQERLKDNPEQFQKKVMELYKRNNANPLGGCLPMLVQWPLFIAFYWTMAGPPFADKVIDIKVNAVAPSAQAVKKSDESAGPSIYISKNNVAAKVVIFPGNSTIVAGEDLTFNTRAVAGKLPPGFAPTWRLVMPKAHEPIDSADGTGHFVFPEVGEYHVQAVIPGIAKNDSFAFVSGLGKVATGAKLLQPANWDIVTLILLFGATMFLAQKLTVPPSQAKAGEQLDEQQIIQQQTMKTTPIVMTAMFFFFPIPAGVYLYLVVSNIFQTLQTWIISKMPEAELNHDTDSLPAIAPNKPSGDAGTNGRNGDNDESKDGTSKKQKKKAKKRKN